MFEITVTGKTPEELKNRFLEMSQLFSNNVKVEGTIAPRRLFQHLEEEEEEQPQIVAAPPAPQVVQTVAPQMPQVEEVEEDEDDTLEEEAPEFDSRGIAWDARIHSATKAKTKDGVWRKMRGADEALVREIEGTRAPVHTPPPMPIITPAAAPMPAPLAVAPVAAAQAPVVPPVPPTTVQVEVPQFQTPPPVVEVTPPTYENVAVPNGEKPAHTLESFKINILPTLATLVKSKKIDQNYIEQVKQYFGVKEIWHVVKNESQLKELFENFCAAGLITKVG